MKQIKIKQSQKGYTLIEVLLVIVLIGILLTIGLVSLNTEARFIENRNDTRKTHIQIIEGAITQYKLQTGSYPTGLDRTYKEICDPDASSCSGFVDLKQFLVPNYLQAIPQDPNDIDSTGGSGYEVAIDTTTNTVSVRLKVELREGGVIIAVNDPLPAEPTVTANTPLAATVPVTLPPPIVTNGLVLHLDAGNTASYPGTGTTWFDLSGNNNNGTLVNGVGYSSANGGSLVFDGVNDYITLGTSTSIVPPYVTASLFVYLNSYSTRPHLIGRGESGMGHFYFVIENFGVFRFYIDIGSGWSFIQPLNFTFPTGTWYNIICTFDGSNVNVYGNGALLATQSRVGQLRQYTSQETVLGRILSQSYLNGNIAQVSIYNRALSATEIQQNFNATRGRFGL